MEEQIRHHRPLIIGVAPASWSIFLLQLLALCDEGRDLLLPNLQVAIVVSEKITEHCADGLRFLAGIGDKSIEGLLKLAVDQIGSYAPCFCEHSSQVRSVQVEDILVLLHDLPFIVFIELRIVDVLEFIYVVSKQLLQARSIHHISTHLKKVKIL